MTNEELRDIQRWRHGDMSAPEPSVPTGVRVTRGVVCECGRVFGEHDFNAWHYHDCPYRKDDL